MWCFGPMPNLLASRCMIGFVIILNLIEFQFSKLIACHWPVWDVFRGAGLIGKTVQWIAICVQLLSANLLEMLRHGGGVGGGEREGGIGGDRRDSCHSNSWLFWVGKKPAEEIGRWAQRSCVVIPADSLSQADLDSAVPQSPPRPISTHGPSYLLVWQRARRKRWQKPGSHYRFGQRLSSVFVFVSIWENSFNWVAEWK